MRPLRLPSLALALGLTLGGPLAACDPTHLWWPVEEASTRDPDPVLLGDVITQALRSAGTSDPRPALVALEDRYRPPGSPLEPWARRARNHDLRFRIEDALLARGLEPVPGEAVEEAMAGGPDLGAYDPATLAGVAEQTGATHLVRLGLLRYANTRVLEEDRFPANDELYRESLSDHAEVRLAIYDASGELVHIDQYEARQTRQEMYWDRGSGRRDRVQLVALPFDGEGTVWHDEANHLPEVRRQGGTSLR